MKLVPLILVLICVNRSIAQFSITTNTDAATLAKTIVGEGVQIFNAKYTGSSYAAGIFQNNTSDLGIKAGVVLTSGRAKTIGGSIGIDRSSNSLASNTSNNFPNNDADLDKLVSFATNDASVLEFDFIPQGDTISVNFVFGSEEYPEWNCSAFNDIFAFLISGPGYTGKVNIALVPGTTIPVSVNSINNGIASNINTCKALGNGAPFTNLYRTNNGNNIVYDGYTKVLTAKAKVQPCVTYHIKLAIADVLDKILDSGVFLEASSFKSSSNINISGDGLKDEQDQQLIAVEGCKQANIYLKRNKADLQYDQAVKLEYKGAENGIDFSLLPTKVEFKPGDSLKELHLIPLVDGLQEGREQLTILMYPNLCSSIPSDSLVLYLKDSFIVHKAVNDFACSLVPKTFFSSKDAIATNSFSWSTGDTTEAIQINKSGTYWVVNNYSGGCYNIDTFYLSNGDPVFTAGPDQNICPGNTAVLQASNPNLSYTWSTSSTEKSISIKDTGMYWLKGVGANGCFVYDTTFVSFKPLALINLESDTALCKNEKLLLNASYPGTAYVWNTGSTNAAITVDKPGIYTVQATLDGCINADTIIVNTKTEAFAEAGLNIEILEGTTASIHAKHSNGNGNYAWSPVEYLHNATALDPTVFPIHNTTYTLTVTSTDGCIATDSVLVTLKEWQIPNAFSPNGDGINDKWIIPYFNNFTNATLEVFNRYGQPVYKTMNYTPWDGTHNGKSLPLGTYYYVITYQHPYPQKSKTGWVSILR